MCVCCRCYSYAPFADGVHNKLLRHSAYCCPKSRLSSLHHSLSLSRAVPGKSSCQLISYTQRERRKSGRGGERRASKSKLCPGTKTPDGVAQLYKNVSVVSVPFAHFHIPLCLISASALTLSGKLPSSLCSCSLILLSLSVLLLLQLPSWFSCTVLINGKFVRFLLIHVVVSSIDSVASSKG